MQRRGGQVHALLHFGPATPRIYVSTYVCMYACMYACLYVRICMYMYVIMYVRRYVYACVYVCMHLCICSFGCWLMTIVGYTPSTASNHKG